MIYPVNVAFASAVDYRIYQLHNCTQKYSVKMAAQTAKLVKRIETIMKPHKFKKSDPVTIFFFLRHLKRTCDSNEVLEVVIIGLLFFFIAKSLPTLPKIGMSPRKDPACFLDGRRGVQVRKRIYAYGKAVKY